MADETVLQNHASRFDFLISRLHDKIEVDSINTFLKIGERKQRFFGFKLKSAKTRACPGKAYNLGCRTRTFGKGNGGS